jgi:hypothetical protein
MKYSSQQQKLALLALCISALLPGSESALANCTWTGGANSNWNTPANWSGGVPGPGDNVTIPAGLATYPVVSTAGAVCSQLYINGNRTPAASLTIVSGGSLTEGGNLTVAPGASIVIHTGGTFTLNANCNDSGNGLLSMDGGTFVFNGANLFIPASLTGGTVDIVDSNPHVGITSFYNLVYSGGTSAFTLEGNTTVSGNLDIASGSQIALNGYSVSANTLTLGGTTETAGGYNTSNASAYISGTSTQVTVSAGPAAPPALCSACAVANGQKQFIMRWSTVSGKTYQIQYTTNCLFSNWTAMGSPVAGTGATICVTNEMTGAPQCFFRLSMQ